MKSFEFQTGKELITGGYLQSDCDATPAESNNIIPTLKPSFCRQRAKRRAPSFASSSLSRMDRGRGALHNTHQNINKRRQLFLFFRGKYEAPPAPKYGLGDVNKCVMFTSLLQCR